MKKTNHDNENKVYVGRKNIRLFPTPEQEDKLFEFLNLYRYVYNWTIEKEQVQIAEYRNRTSEKSIKNKFDLATLFRKEMYGTDRYKKWLNALPTHTRENAIEDAVRAYEYFLNKNTRHKEPHFSRKRHTKQSFRTRADSCRIRDGKLYIEGFTRNKSLGGIDMKTHVYDGFSGYKKENFNGFCTPVVSFNGDYFYLSFVYQEDIVEFDTPKSEPIGIDLGVRQHITTSDGDVYMFPDTSRIDKGIADLDAQISRDRKRREKIARQTRAKSGEYIDLDKLVPKSNRELKREARRRKKYRRKTNIRKYALHEYANAIVGKNPSAICMEDLEVSKMIRKYRHTPIGKALKDLAFYDIRTTIEHKCKKHNIPFILAPKNYPSTKRCSNCGHIHDIGRSKVYECPICGTTLDRDLNAALNLKALCIENI